MKTYGDMNLDELIHLCSQKGFDLDDLVHDVKSEEASSINNRGLSSQIEFLKESFSLHHLKVLLMDLLNQE